MTKVALCLSLWALFVSAQLARADDAPAAATPPAAIYPRAGGVSEITREAELAPPSVKRPSYAIDPNEGFGVLSLPLELAILDPSVGVRAHQYGGGINLRILGRRSTFPVMFGLGVGVLEFGSSQQSGPTDGYRDGDGVFHIGATTEQHSVELRHAELIARVQPWWGAVRPFVELELGLAALWSLGAERQRSASVLYGGSVGLDFRLHCAEPNARWTRCLMLTTALKRWYTGPISRPEAVTGTDGNVATGAARGALSIWLPYLALTLAFDSRVQARRPDPLPTQ